MNRLTHADLPMLRDLRDEFRRALQLVDQWKAEETHLRKLLAYASVRDQLQDWFDAAGRALTRLERLPLGASIPADPSLCSGPGAGQGPASPAGASMPRFVRGAFVPARGLAFAHALRAALERESPVPADPLSAARVARHAPWRKPRPFRYASRPDRGAPQGAAPVPSFGPFGQTLPVQPRPDHDSAQPEKPDHV